MGNYRKRKKKNKQKVIFPDLYTKYSFVSWKLSTKSMERKMISSDDSSRLETWFHKGTSEAKTCPLKISSIFFNISNTIMASSVLDSWLTRLRALIVAQAIQAIRQWISKPPHFVGFMAFKGFLTVIQRKVQRHGDFLIRSHTARSEPNYTRRQQILTNTMPGQGKKNSTSNLHFLTNVEVAGQS